ncbi:hypothetical protein EVA_07685 [gut metagenome]|uniref:Uncharacterized protein n=1 Tax=gut metagenome TaxID=749906 RepID=J9GPA2_9ZZZZ
MDLQEEESGLFFVLYGLQKEKGGPFFISYGLQGEKGGPFFISYGLQEEKSGPFFVLYGLQEDKGGPFFISYGLQKEKSNPFMKLYKLFPGKNSAKAGDEALTRHGKPAKGRGRKESDSPYFPQPKSGTRSGNRTFAQVLPCPEDKLKKGRSS